jgi:ElaB/YqjD/DUF883 family membrane-anchored ribosome-binding protein
MIANLPAEIALMIRAIIDDRLRRVWAIPHRNGCEAVLQAFSIRGTNVGVELCLLKDYPLMEDPMAESRASNTDFGRAFGEAKKNAADVAGDAVDAAQDVYDSASKAARKTAGSFERAVKNTIETQPYTAVVIALGIGWLLGRLHRPI